MASASRPVLPLKEFFTQTTNIGQQTRNQFEVVPEVQVRGGYNVTSNLRLFAGYDFLYMSRVVRPGDQIDTTLNLTGNPAISGVGATFEWSGASRSAVQ